MKTKSIYTFFILCSFLHLGCAHFSESADRYNAAVVAIREGKDYFAIIHLKSIVRDDPVSPYAPNAAFVLGEYYFDNSDYFNAVKTLSDYIHSYPKDKGVVFAKLIIYKIITSSKPEEPSNEQENALIKEIRKELFSQPLFLIFYDKKLPRSYKSLFNNTYLVYDYVDKIKVFRNDKIFLELTP